MVHIQSDIIDLTMHDCNTSFPIFIRLETPSGL
jgi:hypothetical protein